MKLRRSLLFKILSTALLLNLSSFTARAEMSLKNVEIKNCAKTKPYCFKLSAPAASVGSFRQIYVMKDLTLKIEGPKGHNETLQSPLGYLDFDNNQLVLQSKNAQGSLVEKVFNLNTFERKTYTTK
jgi:hypothetical protein